MSTDRDFDRIAAAWLADGPSELADRVLDAALGEVRLTHQRRRITVPWRITSMPTSVFSRAAVAIAIAVVAVGGGLYLLGPHGGSGGGPSPSPGATATATMPPLSDEFVSPSYGYQVAFPFGWQTTPGQGPWPIGENLGHGNPHLDEIKGPVGAQAARFVGASVALPDGTGLDGFMAFASSGSCESIAPLRAPVVVDGVIATVTLNGCHSLSSLGGYIWDVVLVADGRGYDFTLDGALTADEARAWLDTITLDPTAAPAASPSPIDVTGWAPYTSARYGLTMAYPQGWRVIPSDHAWTWGGDAKDWLSTGQDVFRPADGSIRVSAWKVPVDPSARQVESWADVERWASDYCTRSGDSPCAIHDQVVPLCIEKRDCHPALLVRFRDDVLAFGTGGVLGSDMTVVAVWWGDGAPATAPYGGSQRLLEAFLSTMNVFPADATYQGTKDAAATFLATGQ